MSRRLPSAVLACLLAGAGAGCGGEPRPRSALVLTLDTTRADALSCYGAPAGVTPALDALAAEGVRYLAARTVVPLTMPAHVSMWTGLYPPRHGVRTNAAAPLSARAATAAEAARARGIPTAAFVAAAVLARDFGLDQGFDVYDDVARAATSDGRHYDERVAEDVAGAFLAWRATRPRGEPFLAWVHFFDPHLPHAAPDAFVAQAGGDPYLGEVARMDAAIGRITALLRERGELDDTLIVAVGDHGEAFEAHGEGTHGLLCYDATLRVPLIVRDPDERERRGEASREIASVADVAPTVADALGLDLPSGLDGTSLFRARVPEDRGVYFESLTGASGFGLAPLCGWADARSKYLHSSRPELYDPARDPDEERDLIAQHADLAAAARARLAEVLARPALEPPASRAADAERIATLQRLGYTGEVPPAPDAADPLAPSDRPSPADAVGAHRRFLAANDRLGRGRFAEAAAILEELVRENPANALAWTALSTARVKTGAFAASIEAAQRAIALGDDSYGPYESLGVALDNLNRPAEAVEAYADVLARRPAHREIRDRMVVLLRRLGRADEAERVSAGAGS